MSLTPDVSQWRDSEWDRLSPREQHALEMYRYRILLRERQRDVRGEVICAICGEAIERRRLSCGDDVERCRY